MTSASTGGQAPAAEPTILIVDDDAAVRSLLKAAVQASAAHCRVYEAADSDTALRFARSTQIDLVLLDIVLPNSALSGVMVCQELCRDQRTKVVIVSGSSSKTIMDACLSAGALECVKKPFTLDDMRPRVQGWLHGGCPCPPLCGGGAPHERGEARSDLVTSAARPAPA